MTREYDNSKRAARSAETAEQILQAAEELLRRSPDAEVTLQDVADHAGVTVKTVLRHHDNREGVLLGVALRLKERVDAQRTTVTPGDVEAAVDNVLAHYEAEGDLVLRLLSEETTSRVAAEVARGGRAFHRAWVATVFGPRLGATERDHQIDALVVSTDLYTWRLLRRDLGRELTDVRAVTLRLVRANLGELT